MSARPVCIKCMHYFITYEPSNPYGCRAMGFKSRKNPARVVFESSGMECQLFKAKKQGGDPKSGRVA
ncbi:uracil-DNA glycosylase [Desulforhopalus sp. IMCC35007]|nr:uracil-DNA glycosylase [Desulforhopalus sp. IMCC35007]